MSNRALLSKCYGVENELSSLLTPKKSYRAGARSCDMQKLSPGKDGIYIMNRLGMFRHDESDALKTDPLTLDAFDFQYRILNIES